MHIYKSTYHIYTTLYLDPSPDQSEHRYICCKNYKLVILQSAVGYDLSNQISPTPYSARELPCKGVATTKYSLDFPITANFFFCHPPYFFSSYFCHVMFQFPLSRHYMVSYVSYIALVHYICQSLLNPLAFLL